MESSTVTKTIAIETNDAMLFHVEEPVAMEFGVVKRFFDDNPDASSFPLPNVDRKQLAKIIAFCEGRLEFRSRKIPADDAEVKAYDKEFLAKFKPSDLKSLALAANYLEAKEVLDVLLQAIADLIANRSAEYVRKLFGIECDYTAAELEDMRKRDSWAYEGVEPDLHDE